MLTEFVTVTHKVFLYFFSLASLICLGLFFHLQKKLPSQEFSSFHSPPCSPPPAPARPGWRAAVPSDKFSDDFLLPGKVDRSGDFTRRCGRNHFHLTEEDLAEGSFCREAVVSLTADFNGGALDCGCHQEGASPFNECEPVGGQCSCK